MMVQVDYNYNYTGTKFTSSIDDLTYTFVSVSDKVVQPVDGIYTAQSLDVYEGTYVTYSYTYDSADIDQRFLIPSDRADTTTIKVVVQNSSSDVTQNTYVKATSITELDGTSKVYFLQEELKMVNMKYILVMVLLVNL